MATVTAMDQALVKNMVSKPPSSDISLDAQDIPRRHQLTGRLDLSASQRIGAGVGSGIMSALMLGFFMYESPSHAHWHARARRRRVNRMLTISARIFGCLLQLPARDESNSLTAQTSNEEPRSRAAGRHIDAHSQYPVMGDGFQRESITPEQIKVAASNTYPQMSQSRGLV